MVTFSYDSHLKVEHVDASDLAAGKDYLDQLDEYIFDLQSNMNSIRGNEWSHQQSLKANSKIVQWGNIAKIGLLVMISS